MMDNNQSTREDILEAKASGTEQSTEAIECAPKVTAPKKAKKSEDKTARAIKKLKRKLVFQGIWLTILTLLIIALGLYSFLDVIKYTYAESLIDKGDIEGAVDILSGLTSYEPASELLDKYKFSVVGNIVTFGSYEQDADTSNGNEPLEWIVLKYENGRALLTTKYCIDCKQYKADYGSVTWEKSDIRSWLNNRFIEKAFSAAEKAMLLDNESTADPNPKYKTQAGNITADKVFLLSADEFSEYLEGGEYAIGYTTAYARERGVQSGPISGTSVCWLRTPGESMVYVSTVSYVGELNLMGVYSYSSACGIRPAIWIDTNID